MTLRAAPYGSDIASGLNRLLAWFAERPSTAWITFDRVEFGANVAMFVPLGVIAVLWFGVRGWWLAPILGALSTLLFHAAPGEMLVYLGFFSGFLLYIGASDVLPEAHSHDRSGVTGRLIVLTCLGAAFIFVVTRVA